MYQSNLLPAWLLHQHSASWAEEPRECIFRRKHSARSFVRLSGLRMTGFTQSWNSRLEATAYRRRFRRVALTTP